MNVLTLLLIEDNPGDARLLHEMLRDFGNGYQIVWVQTLAEAQKEFATKRFHLILCDLGLQDSQGFDTASAVIAAAPDMPIIILTGQDDNQIALEAIKAGAQDYLIKNTVTPELIGRSIRYAIERKQAEKELRSQGNLLKKVFEILPIGLWIADKNGVLLKANAAGVKIWGAEPLVGQQDYGVFKARRLPSKEYIAPDDWALAHSINKGMTIEGEELEIDAFDGRKKTILNYTAPVLNDNGQVEASVVVNVDVTDRKQIEEELVKLSRAVEQSPASVVITDLDGNIEYVNPKFTEITGYTLEEVKGQNSRILKSGETSPEEYHKLWETITSGLVWHGELHNRRKDGSLFWERASISPVRNTKGTITHFLAVKEDITVEKSLEMQLLQAQKLEAVGLLTGGIAHDFNNLLTTIIGNAELAIGEVGKDSPPYEFLEDIKGAGERAAALTRQLLAFSRKQILQPEPANLNEVLGNMDRMLRRVIPENIEIKTILSPDLCQVYVDVGQMEQVLMNLAVNALDVMPEGGKLTLETSNAELDETYARTHIGVTSGPYVMLAVTDTGIGMTKDVQAKIFEPFFTTKEKGKGTGLGLSTVYGIVKQSKGNIWVYSEPGKGSTFKVYLPRVEETVRIVEEAEEVAESLQGSETILLVEDDGLVRNIALKILRNYGYTVLCAGDGEEALHICRQHQEPVQLMLADVVMPGVSGRELAKRLEELRPEMKVLFMSGYTDNAIVHNGILDKGIAFITKPFTPVDLSRKVREVLNK